MLFGATIITINSAVAFCPLGRNHSAALAAFQKPDKRKIIDFSNNEALLSIFLDSTTEKPKEETIKELLAQIEFLKKEIARLQSLLAEKIGTRPISPQESLRLPTGQACQKLENNLYFGLMNNPEVRCLQEFLKSQGPEFILKTWLLAIFFL